MGKITVFFTSPDTCSLTCTLVVTVVRLRDELDAPGSMAETVKTEGTTQIHYSEFVQEQNLVVGMFGLVKPGKLCGNVLVQ